MNSDNQSKFTNGLITALRKERASQRIYHALAQHETNEARRDALLALAETEHRHSERWAERLVELGIALPADRDTLIEKIWQWVLVQSGTDNALKRIENNEEDDTQMYETLSQIAPTETDRNTIQAVKHDEQVHSGAMQKTSNSSSNTLTGPQVMRILSCTVKAGIEAAVAGSVRQFMARTTAWGRYLELSQV